MYFEIIANKVKTSGMTKHNSNLGLNPGGGGGHSENILVGCALTHQKEGSYRCGHNPIGTDRDKPASTRGTTGRHLGTSLTLWGKTV